jgi:hypothetical protein
VAEADPEFATALKDAEVEALDRLRGAAHKRALSRSHAMLMFLLKRLQPEVFGDQPRHQNLQVNVQQTANTTCHAERLSDDELETMQRLLLKVGV